jgi:hypothetical protein
MEGSCSTGQSTQRAVVPMEKEEELVLFTRYTRMHGQQNTREVFSLIYLLRGSLVWHMLV